MNNSKKKQKNTSGKSESKHCSIPTDWFSVEREKTMGKNIIHASLVKMPGVTILTTELALIIISH